MKRILLCLSCVVLITNFASQIKAQYKYKTLWKVEFDIEHESSSVHYTANTVIVVFKDRFKDSGFYFNTYAYCSGEQQNKEPFYFPVNLIPETIEACDGKLVYVTHSSDSSEYSLVSSNLKFEQKWTNDIKPKTSPKFVWCEARGNLVIVHMDNDIYIFDLVTGNFLYRMDDVFTHVDSIWNGMVFVKSDQLKLIDPYIQKTLWVYDIPKPGFDFHGVKNNIVLLSTTHPKENKPSRVICLDASTGKEVFKMEYNDSYICDINISNNILGITCIDEINDNIVLDAFNTDSWAFLWSTKIPKNASWFIFSDLSIYYFNFWCPDDLTLWKIDTQTGKVDFHARCLAFDEKITWKTFMKPRNVVFQSNRSISANHLTSITCYIDETF